MSNYWTLHVKDFAKIREAKIEAAPLTLFVGDNNSGKSYLLSLLWGLTGGVDFSLLASAEQKNATKFNEVENLLNFWRTRDYRDNVDFPEHKDPLPVNAEEQCVLTEGFNAFLEVLKDKLVSEIFNTDEVRVQSIRLGIPFREDLRVGFQEQNAFGHLSWKFTTQETIRGFRGGEPQSFFCHYVDLVLDRSIFIPAPRTGFLLTFRTLIQQSIHDKFSFRKESEPGDYLTSPQVSFLKRRAALRMEEIEKFREPIREILDFVERDIIYGELKLTKTPLPELLYKPEGMDRILPLYLSSGVVTEVAGFLSLLKFGQFGRICIYEEPEMCLHPELQWKMARVLVKLVNAGFTVWASTHSDIIIQHVNNMIKLSNHPDGEQLRKNHDYDEDDVISREKVRMYQFDVNPVDHKTDVKPLEDGVNGFRIPTFGKVFRELRDEVWNFRIEKKEDSA